MADPVIEAVLSTNETATEATFTSQTQACRKQTHYPMLARNLLYTGVTRGKRLVVLIGQPKACALASAMCGPFGG